MSFKIESQLSENQIESDVASYLGYITPIWSKRFRLIQVDEQLTGADKLFNRFLPIYLQFKVSHGLNPSAPILKRVLNKPLSNIISYRKKNNLSGNPILYFKLRRIAKTAANYQHNILFSLHKPPTQYALYIAPLTLDLAEYEKQLNDSWRYRYFTYDPFDRRDLDIFDSPQGKKIVLGSNPFLRHHIAIPPHTNVATHEHHYSYSQTAGDVAWHGGELLNNDFRLSTQLINILSEFYNDESRNTLEGYARSIVDLANSELRSDNLIFSNDPFSTIQAFARILRRDYNINLMLLAEFKDNF